MAARTLQDDAAAANAQGRRHEESSLSELHSPAKMLAIGCRFQRQSGDFVYGGLNARRVVAVIVARLRVGEPCRRAHFLRAVRAMQGCDLYRWQLRQHFARNRASNAGEVRPIPNVRVGTWTGENCVESIQKALSGSKICMLRLAPRLHQLYQQPGIHWLRWNNLGDVR